MESAFFGRLKKTIATDGVVDCAILLLLDVASVSLRNQAIGKSGWGQLYYFLLGATFMLFLCLSVPSSDFILSVHSLVIGVNWCV